MCSFVYRSILVISALILSMEVVAGEAYQSVPASKKPIELSLSRIPHFRMRADDNDPSFYSLDEKFYSGNGQLIKLYPLHNDFAVSLLNIDLDSENAGLDPKLQSLMVGFRLFQGEITRSGDYSVTYELFSSDVGVARYKYEIGDSGMWTLYGQIRAAVGIYVFDRIRVNVGATYHIIGHPGETVGYGLYDFLELSLQF